MIPDNDEASRCWEPLFLAAGEPAVATFSPPLFLSCVAIALIWKAAARLFVHSAERV